MTTAELQELQNFLNDIEGELALSFGTVRAASGLVANLIAINRGSQPLNLGAIETLRKVELEARAFVDRVSTLGEEPKP